jgi:hypothetical protein
MPPEATASDRIRAGGHVFLLWILPLPSATTESSKPRTILRPWSDASQCRLLCRLTADSSTSSDGVTWIAAEAGGGDWLADRLPRDEAGAACWLEVPLRHSEFFAAMISGGPTGSDDAE